MSTRSVECNDDIDSYDKVEAILSNLFGAVLDLETIQSIIVSCDGNLSNCIENILKESDLKKKSLKLSGPTLVNTEIQSEDAVKMQGSSIPSPAGPSTSRDTRRQDKASCKDKKTNNKKSSDVGLNYDHNPGLKKIINYIKSDVKIVILMRGLPGSGKSHLANLIIQATDKCSSCIFSTDEYFTNRSGQYCFNSTKLSEAHSWNLQRFLRHVQQGYSPAIVDNTNIQTTHMQPYIQAGVNHGYIIEILEPQTSWALRPHILAQKNHHNVPQTKLKKLLENYVPNITADYVMSQYNITYASGSTPPLLCTDQTAPTRHCAPRTKTPFSSCLPTQNSAQTTDSQNPTTSTEYQQQQKQQHYLSGHSSDGILENHQISRISVDPEGKGDTVGVKCSVPNILESIEKRDTSKVHSLQNHSPKPQRSSDSGKRQNVNVSSSIASFSQCIDWEPIDQYLSTNVTSAEQVEIPMLSLAGCSIAVSCESATNTHSSDFEPSNPNNFPSLKTVRREINTIGNVFESPSKLQSSMFPLDKGTMTDQDEDTSKVSHDIESKIQRLKELGNAVGYAPDDYIRDILEKCQGNEDWAGEILLDGKNDDGSLNIPQRVSTLDNVTTFQDYDRKIEGVTSQGNDLENCNFDTAAGTSSKHNIVNKSSKKDKLLSEDSIVLKREVEKSFSFRDDLYSNHILKIKRKNRGEKPPIRDIANNLVEDTAETEDTDSSNESSDCEKFDSSGESSEKVVSLRMGKDFMEQLDNVFGYQVYNDNLEPVIHMPMSLLNQIHALWLESVCNQMDVQKEYLKAIEKEDEEFARYLEAKENERRSQGMVPEVPNLKEIMDMEVALALYKTDMADWQKESPQDLASRLTRQKLVQLFPNIEEQMLLEIFNASNNNFEQVVEELLVSTGIIPLNQPEGTAQSYVQALYSEHERDLIDRAKQEKEKITNTQKPEYSNQEEDAEKLDFKTAIDMLRQEAQHHVQIRNVNYAKAQEYCRNGFTQAATYYSQMAALHTRKHEYANNLAASRIMQAGTRSQDQSILDLHHFYVAEAIQALHMFLDRHISDMVDKLNARPSSRNNPATICLYLVTGRGRHSPGGQPRIKPEVIKILHRRGLRYGEVNPGLLDVVVGPYDVLSNNLGRSTTTATHNNPEPSTPMYAVTGIDTYPSANVNPNISAYYANPYSPAYPYAAYTNMSPYVNIYPNLYGQANI